MLKKANGFHESVNNECDLTSVFNRFLEPQDFLTGFLLLTGRGSSCVATIVFHASLYIFDVHVQPMEKIFKGILHTTLASQYFIDISILHDSKETIKKQYFFFVILYIYTIQRKF